MSPADKRFEHPDVQQLSDVEFEQAVRAQGIHVGPPPPRRPTRLQRWWHRRGAIKFMAYLRGQR